LNYTVKVLPEEDFESKDVKVYAQLENKMGEVVADSHDGHIVVPNVTLWWPFTMVKDDADAGYLYTLKVD